MSRGAGNYGRTNKNEPAAVVPVTGARSGTSLVGGFVELGGGLSPLLHNTVIVTGLFDFVMRDTGNVVFLEWDESALQAILGDQSGDTNVVADMATGAVGIGDNFSQGNFTNFGVVDSAQQIIGNSAGGQLLRLDKANDLYLMGDISALFNQTVLALADSSQQGSISAGGFTMLFLDMQNGIFQLGASAGGTANTTFFQVDDPNQRFTTVSGGSVQGMQIDATLNPIIRLGDIANTGSGLTLQINDASNLLYVAHSTGTPTYFSLDKGNNTYRMGDIDLALNSTYIEADDGNLAVRLNAPLGAVQMVATGNGLRLNGDGLLIHAFGTAFTNGAGASVGTLTNSPSAGNPTKWIPIDDNGTTRHIPAW